MTGAGISTGSTGTGSGETGALTSAIGTRDTSDDACGDTAADGMVTGSPPAMAAAARLISAALGIGAAIGGIGPVA